MRASIAGLRRWGSPSPPPQATRPYRFSASLRNAFSASLDTARQRLRRRKTPTSDRPGSAVRSSCLKNPPSLAAHKNFHDGLTGAIVAAVLAAATRSLARRRRHSTSKDAHSSTGFCRPAAPARAKRRRFVSGAPRRDWRSRATWADWPFGK